MSSSTSEEVDAPKAGALAAETGADKGAGAGAVEDGKDEAASKLVAGAGGFATIAESDDATPAREEGRARTGPPCCKGRVNVTPLPSWTVTDEVAEE
jgi:hypothetical protein